MAVAAASPDKSSPLSAYLSTLKALEVEEPIDLWLHRPLAFVVARLLYPTPISANLVTLCSLVLGLLGSAAMFLNFPHHLAWAGLLIFAGTILDCADGQLARLRKSFSHFGRMLDGSADVIGQVSAAAGAIWVVWTNHSARPELALVVVVMSLVTCITTSIHTCVFDHYKNLYLRVVYEKGGEGEDYEVALERYQRSSDRRLWIRCAWFLYFMWLKSQRDYIARFDPFTRFRYSQLPAFDPQNAEIYRRQQLPLLRWWRGFFGSGSLMFGLCVSIALGVPEYYMLFRLLVLGALFYGYLRPAQRRASQATFAEIGLAPEAPLAQGPSPAVAFVGK